MKNKGISSLCVVAILGAAYGGVVAGDSEYTIDTFVQAAAEHVQKSGLPGVAVAVVRPDGRYWATGFGYADIGAKKPMTENSIISIGSVSKTITGVSVMQLVEKGKIALNGDINDILSFNVKNPKQLGKTITPRHVLTHTSGLVDNEEIYGSPVSYHFGGDNPIELRDFLKDYYSPGHKYYSEDANFANTAPGANFEYSNVAYGLAGHLVEAASGQAFNAYTAEHVFKPLGMNDTGWKYSEVPFRSTCRYEKYHGNSEKT